MVTSYCFECKNAEDIFKLNYNIKVKWNCSWCGSENVRRNNADIQAKLKRNTLKHRIKS